jgi:hypothetical protein
MPNRIPYSPWADVAQFGQNLGGGIGALALQIPEFRLRQQQLLAQQRLNASHAGYYDVQAESERQLLPLRISKLQEEANLHREQITSEREQGQLFGARAIAEKEQGRLLGAKADREKYALSGIEAIHRGAAGLGEAMVTGKPVDIAHIRDLARGIESSSDADLRGFGNLVQQALTVSGSGLGVKPDLAQAALLGEGSRVGVAPGHTSLPIIRGAPQDVTIPPMPLSGPPMPLPPGFSGPPKPLGFSPSVQVQVPGQYPPPYVSPVQQQPGTGPSQVPLVTSDLQMHGFTPEQAMAIKLGALRTLGHTNLPGMQSGQQPLYARNPQTGQRIMSLDGGQTWQQAQ